MGNGRQFSESVCFKAVAHPRITPDWLKIPLLASNCFHNTNIKVHYLTLNISHLKDDTPLGWQLTKVLHQAAHH